MKKLDNIKLCIVGLGYVGLPLAHAFAKKRTVIGFDISEKRVNELRQGVDKNKELGNRALGSVASQLSYTTQVNEISDCDVYIITVPTPIDRMNKPDLTPLIRASEVVGKVLKEDDIVIYESTVYPGVTEDVCVPVLEKFSQLTFNENFYCGYSPERINPGDKKNTITNILKITSGSTLETAELVDNLYGSIIKAGTHRASSIKVAEAAKVIENTQRDVNIALINELAIIFDNLGIDTNEVIEAAATKWNFIKLKPGLVGGHCIGVDPYYLTYKAEELGYKPNLVLGARQINNGMGKYIANKTIKLLNHRDNKIKGSRVLVMGLTFKENCPDVRNTKVIDIIEELCAFDCQVDVYEPLMEENDKDFFKFNFVETPLKRCQQYDAVIVAVEHDEFCSYSQADFESLLNTKGILIDVKGIVPDATWRL